MNKKGFTVVELIASFALTITISVFLFEVLIEVKDIFVESSIKTAINEKVGVISKNIKLNLPNAQITCDNTYKRCTSGGKTIVNLKPVDNNITYILVGNQQFSMPNIGGSDITVINQNVSAPTCQNSGCYLTVQFELSHPALAENYEYKAVYYYSIN